MKRSLEQLTDEEVDLYLKEIPFEKWKRDYSSNRNGIDFSSRTEFCTKINKNDFILLITLGETYFEAGDEESDGVIYRGYNSTSHYTEIICKGLKIYEVEDKSGADRRFFEVQNEFDKRERKKKEAIERKKKEQEIAKQSAERSKIRDIVSRLR